MHNANQTNSSGRRWMPWVAGVAGVLAVIGAVAALAAVRAGEGTGVPSALVYVAERGPLVISVTESGTIKSRQQEIIKSEVEGQTTIIYLVPEGTQVKRGDLLVELDVSRLQDQQIERQMSVTTAEASLIRARENLEVVRNQARADMARATLDAQFAVEDLQNYENGQFPKDHKELRARIKLAEEEVQRAIEKLRWSRILHGEKYISQTELQADELSEMKAQLDLDLAHENLKLLENFTRPRRIAELKSHVEQTAMALERVTRKADADILQAETDLRVRESELARQQSQLERVNRQIERTRIVAPNDGLAVYATSAQSGGGFRGNTEPLAEGQSVRERQELIYLPRTTQMMAEVSVHESALDQVRTGLAVRITVDALPGRAFGGRVVRVAPLPDAQSMWMNPDLKVYRTEIHIDGDGADLRTGMSCRAEIIVERIPDAVYVPVQSVLRVRGEPTVYVLGPGGQPQARPVGLGMDNNRMAHIVSGLEAGERVLLKPPLAEASAQPVAEMAAEPDAAAPPIPVEPPVVAGVEDGGPEAPAGRRGQRGEMSAEQMEQMRRRMEGMTAEEREQARRRFQRGGEEGRSGPE